MDEVKNDLNDKFSLFGYVIKNVLVDEYQPILHVKEK